MLLACLILIAGYFCLCVGVALVDEIQRELQQERHWSDPKWPWEK